MTFTAADFRQAIDTGNVRLVEEILAQRDPATGIPLVDINRITHLGTTALNYLIGSQNFERRLNPDLMNARYEIAERILAVRDRLGNPIIDLNQCNGIGQISLTALQDGVSSKRVFTEPQARNLFHRIVNLCRSDGTRILDFNADNSTVGILRYTVRQQDPVNLETLLDAREANGEHSIDVNRTCHGGTQLFAQRTALDVALGGSYYSDPLPNHIPNQQIVQILRNYGGRTWAELQQNVWVAPQVPLPMPAVLPPPEPSVFEVFEDNPQNIHDPRVEKSANYAIERLCKTYYPTQADYHLHWMASFQKDVDQSLEEIQAHIQASPRTQPQEKLILQGLAYITGATGIHTNSYLSLKEILALVWKAASDQTAPDPSNPNLDLSTLVKMRKEGILDHIHAAETIYGNRRSCLGGYRNHIIHSLDRVHECVQIIHTDGEAKEVAVDSLKFWIKKELDRLPLSEQKAILKAWADLPDGVSENRAYQFHMNGDYQKNLKTLLEDTYGANLTFDEKDAFFVPEAWLSFPRPIFHLSLDTLIQKIEQLSSTSFSKLLQKAAQNAFQENRSYDQDYEWLSRQYKIYQAYQGLAPLPNDGTYAIFRQQMDRAITSAASFDEFTSQFQTAFQAVEKPRNTLGNLIKNICMICLPILGWFVLLYRAFYYPEIFFITEKQRVYSYVKNTISNYSEIVVKTV